MIRILLLLMFLFVATDIYACPSSDLKNGRWVEHAAKLNNSIKVVLADHFLMPVSQEKGSVYMLMASVNVRRGKGIFKWREVIWSVHRTNKTCFLSGSVAYYTEIKNREGWPPTVDFLNASETEQKLFEDGVFGLIELRWYDYTTNKKHRWFNKALANRLSWVKDYLFSPISLPRVINSLD